MVSRNPQVAARQVLHRRAALSASTRVLGCLPRLPPNAPRYNSGQSPERTDQAIGATPSKMTAARSILRGITRAPSVSTHQADCSPSHPLGWRQLHDLATDTGSGVTSWLATRLTCNLPTTSMHMVIRDLPLLALAAMKIPWAICPLQ